MKVVQYLKEFGIEKLKKEFSIKVKEYDEGLIVLNYDQILSQKSHPIVMECRGLILDKEFNIVSRSFSRFFNLGECPETQEHIDMSKASCVQKLDGSLIKIFYWNNQWNISTRGTAFAESEVNGFGITFRDLVLSALGRTDDDFQYSCAVNLNRLYTYICEVVSMENRVVTRYDERKLYFLAARNNETGEYGSHVQENDAYFLGCKMPDVFNFSSTEDCVEAAKVLKDLDEGYVLVQDGIPVCKIKSPAYVAVHLLKSEGLNPKRICELVLTGEQDEYLKYFEEDRQHVEPYVNRLQELHFSMALLWTEVESIESQKDFAMKVKDEKFSAVLFHRRKNGGTIAKSWEAQSDPYKLKLFMESMQ